MSYKFMPYVLSTTPENMAVDVPTSTAISIVFSIDMDPASLPGNIIVQSASGGIKVDGTITYKDRTAVFTPSRELDPATAYTVIVAGDVDLEDGKHTGVRSMLGYPMAGVHTFAFTTAAVPALPAPRLISPANMSVVTPGMIELVWEAVTGADLYEVQVAAAPEMEPLLWQTTAAQTRVVPDYDFAPGSYFWRVRAVSAGGTNGAWAETASFAAAAAIEGAIDGEPAAGYMPYAEARLEVPDGEVDVDPSLDAITLRLPYPVGPDDVRVRLVGRSAAGDPTADHGLVPVSLTVTTDGLTTVIVIAAREEAV